MSGRSILLSLVLVGALLGLIVLAAVLRTERDVPTARRTLYGHVDHWRRSALQSWPQDESNQQRAQAWRAFLFDLPHRMDEGLAGLEADPKLMELVELPAFALSPPHATEILDYGLVFDGVVSLQAMIERDSSPDSHPRSLFAALRLSGGLRAVSGVDCVQIADRLERAALDRLSREARTWTWDLERLEHWTALLDQTRLQQPSITELADVEALIAQATLLGLCGIRPFSDAREEWDHARPEVSPVAGLEAWDHLAALRDNLYLELARPERSQVRSEYRVWRRYAIQESAPLAGVIASNEALPTDLHRLAILRQELELRLLSHRQLEGRFPEELGNLWTATLAPVCPSPPPLPPSYRSLDNGVRYELGTIGESMSVSVIISESTADRE